MAFHITDTESDRLLRDLADLRVISLTEAIRLAVRRELSTTSLAGRLRPLQVEVAASIRAGGRPPDPVLKAFFDSLDGETAGTRKPARCRSTSRPW